MKRSYEISSVRHAGAIGALMALTGCLFAFDGLPSFQSGPEQVALLELYSSEGCSSCPPAETWASALKNNPDLWQRWVPVAFHVDYWDTLGWRDRLGSKRYSVRQQLYADALGLSSVYTPEFFLNGREWRGFFDGSASPAPERLVVGALSVKAIGSDQFLVTFEPAGSSTEKWEVHLAALGFGITSVVTAGENKGSTLHHDFAVLGLSSAPLKENGGHVSAILPLTVDAASAAAPQRGIAVWVTRAGDPTPVQAAGGYLPADSPK